MRNWLFVKNNIIRTFVGLPFINKIQKTIPSVDGESAPVFVVRELGNQSIFHLFQSYFNIILLKIVLLAG